MKPVLKQFIIDHLDDIDDEEFDALYTYAKLQTSIEVNELTEVLLLAGIDPLPKLKIIPVNYMFDFASRVNIHISPVTEVIDRHAFSFSEILKVVFPENGKLSDIHARAFESCQHLKSVHIPKSVTYIGPRAFKNCEHLVKVTFDAQCNAEISPSTFRECTSLTEIICNENIKEQLPEELQKKVVLVT